ncbi:MAG: hypothetical protein P4L46_08220 [Fimbriimonas sp.]|nr:hypothetical protein [Fimbriimonas sp.]
MSPLGEETERRGHTQHSGDRRDDHIFLPYEADAVLAIVLSKALMVANDEITDSTITRQL